MRGLNNNKSIMGEVIVIKIILLHLIAEAIVCFLGMITMDHTTIQKYLRGTLFIECEFCCEKIAIGQKYVRQTNIYDGTIYDFVTHQECNEVAHELNMYDDCDDSGLDGDSFRENLNAYVYANHYDEHTDDVYTSWQLNYYEIAKKILKELKTEK